jgi:hypothetical protein
MLVGVLAPGENASPPGPPPVAVTEEKIEDDPCAPIPALVGDAAPAPTVIV